MVARKSIMKLVMDLWEDWSIRGLIICSLALQTILVFFAPSRKRTAKKLLVLLIWFAYLLADWSANYTVGQISDSQYHVDNDGESKRNNPELLAFWTPFLLLHLGGPDTITALAVEDNELWRRHLLGLVFQAISSLYVVLLSIPNRLLVPTVLVFVAGVIKSVERTKALYAASLENMHNSMFFMPRPKPSYAQLMEDYARRINGKRDPEAEVTKTPKPELTNIEVVQKAYGYFKIYKFPAFKSIFNSWQQRESRDFFLSQTAESALEFLEVELGFMYDSNFTKADILHTWAGAIFRFLGLGCLVASLCMFVLLKKNGYERFDINLTYALLIGGMALEFIALVMYCLSDWTFARLKKLNGDNSRLKIILNWALGLKKLKWRRCICCKGHEFLLHRNFMLRRWSESVPGYSLLGYCLRIRPKNIHRTKRSLTEMITQWLFIDPVIIYISQGISSCFLAMKQTTRPVIRCLFNKCQVIHYPVKLLVSLWLAIVLPLRCWIDEILEFFGLMDQKNEIMYTSSRRLSKELWEFIYEEVTQRSSSDIPKVTNEVYGARGDWTPRRLLNVQSGNEAENGEMFKSVTETDYNKSILVWHIATELIYQSQATTDSNYMQREHSKSLSDYMMYLMLMRPTLMPKVSGITRLRIKDTSREVKILFEKRQLEKTRDMKQASEAILSLSTVGELKGCQNKSVLYEAHMVAKELEELENVWEVVSKVWVELLCYAAAHCDSEQHVAQLSKGSQLISIVRILVSHLAIVVQKNCVKDPTSVISIGP